MRAGRGCGSAESEVGLSGGGEAASGNPGPALAYIKQYAADTKKTLLARLKAAPKEVQRKAEAEFERLLGDALGKAVRNSRVPERRFGWVTLTVRIATYNHWCAVRYKMPELLATQRILRVQLYEVRFRDQERRIPLPNTFQPYARIQIALNVR